MGKRAIFSDAVSKDWKEQYFKKKGLEISFPLEKVIERTLKKTKKGSIVNFHDYLEGVGDNKQISKLLDNYLREISKEKYKLVTVSELLNF